VRVPSPGGAAHNASVLQVRGSRYQSILCRVINLKETLHDGPPGETGGVIGTTSHPEKEKVTKKIRLGIIGTNLGERKKTTIESSEH